MAEKALCITPNDLTNTRCPTPIPPAFSFAFVPGAAKNCPKANVKDGLRSLMRSALHFRCLRPSKSRPNTYPTLGGTNNTNPNYGKKNNDKVMIKR